ncbi:MAG TPA: endonuclease/exonuclease/phosphatase family protein [Candidatus Saccharimonadales bacterium]
MQVKVICLNLWRGGLLMDGIIDYLNKERPDVLMLQEVLACDDPAAPERFHSLETLKRRLSWEHESVFAPAFLDNAEDYRNESGNAVISRFPIKAHHVTPYDTPFAERTERNAEAFAATPRNLQHVILDADGHELNIFNTQGVWDLDGDSASDRRKAMCQTIAGAVKGKKNVIFAGDTNLKPTNAALAPLDAVLQTVFQKDELQTSFNVNRKDLKKFPGYATAVVDLMYVNHDVTVLEHSCPDVDISDHLPLVALCEIS